MLADGRQYTFTYEPGTTAGTVTGRIASITLPDGGSLSYAYMKNPSTGASINCNDGRPLGFTRTVNDGKGNTASWIYQSSNNVTTLTDPTGASSIHTFVPINGNLGGAFSGQEYVEVSAVYYDAAHNVLSTVKHAYNGVAQGSSPAYPITNIVTTSFLPDATGVAKAVSQSISPLGMPTETDVYDYGVVGSAAAGSLLSKTTTSYSTSLGLVYDRPTNSTTYGPDGKTVTAQSTFSYDQSAVVATTGVPNHNTGYNVGNLTTFSRLTSSGKSLTSTYTYYDTGNIATATDVNGATTTYTYNQCGNSLLSGVSTKTNAAVPVTLSSSLTWNCDSSTIASKTDPNGNTSTFSYHDPYYRASSAEDAFGNTVEWSYPSNSSHTATSVTNFNNDTSTSTSVTTYDGLARPVLQQERQGVSSTSYDSVSTTYNSVGQVAYISVPYTAAAGSFVTSGPGVTTTYDGIGRTAKVQDGGGGYTQYAYSYNDVTITRGPAPAGESAKVRVLEADGSGALRSVCEVSSTLPSTGACGQNVGGTGDSGYLTKYTSVPGTFTVQQDAQPGGIGVQTRTMSYDLLGRTTSETIPELGSNGTPGTMVYHYDSDSSGKCGGTYPGDLVYEQDAAGNVTCFTYDNQHRLLSSIVTAGPQSTVTAQNHYVYDVATVNGTAMQNAKGSMVEAYTCANPGSCSTKLTDVAESIYPEGSPGSYTGRVIQQTLESTPNSAGYFSLQATTYPNGARASLSIFKGATAILPTISYSLDGEGRPNSVTDTTNALNLVTATAYSPWSGITSTTYGNGDSDTFTLDPNTGRLTGFKSAIAASTPFSTTGTLGWNANGSLGSFGWADTNEPAKNQSCTYSADDLNRINKANCGSAFGETYTYTAFGNISKAVLTSGKTYAPTYNVATNQVSGSALATYDANGNQTMTTQVASMSWNASHNPVTVAGTNMTYDALGRLVEFSGAHYSQVLYGPSGEKVGVYSNGVASGSFALPGGGEAYYNGLNTLTALRHKDWLGSSRLATTWAHVVYSKTAYAPHGENYYQSGTADLDFTGQTQSSAPYLFDFLARKYDPNAGRWIAPDPGEWSVVDATNPQSFNRYAYVINSPLNLTDPAGFDYIFCPTGGLPQGTGSGTVTPPVGCISISDGDWGAALAQTTNCTGSSGAIYCDGVFAGVVSYVAPANSQNFYGPSNGQGGQGTGQGALSGTGGNSGSPAPNNQPTIFNCPDSSGHDPCKNIWVQSDCVVNKPVTTMATDMGIGLGTAGTIGAVGSRGSGALNTLKGAGKSIWSEALGIYAAGGVAMHAIYKTGAALINGCTDD